MAPQSPEPSGRPGSAVAPLDLRLASAADARWIADLQVRAWRAAYRGLLPDALLDNLSIDDRERVWRRWNVGDPRRRIWLAVRGDALIGFAATGPSRDDDVTAVTGEVYAIYLEPALIGTGLGRTLFAHAVDALRAQGFTVCTLWVLENNARTRRFYEAAGWQIDGARKTERMAGGELIEVRYRRALS